MSWDPSDEDDDWRPNRAPSGLCNCDDCNRPLPTEENER